LYKDVKTVSDAGPISRRKFLRDAAVACAAASAGPVLSSLGLPAVAGAEAYWDSFPMEDEPEEEFLVEARHYDKLPHKKIRCRLCPRECLIDDLERGYCGVRDNRDGTYYTLVHSRPCTWHADPIEKKPLFHFLPGTQAFSISTVGCNMECKFCQNWQISQIRPEQSREYKLPPASVAQAAVDRGCRSIAYTYAEPIIFYEYMYDCAIAGHQIVMISNGYINERPMRDLCPHLDAVKIDLKAYTEAFYRDQCVGELVPVLKTLEVLKDEGMWFEIVYLVIPTLNDDRQEIREMCTWILKALGPDVPVHFTQFHPQYRLLNLPSTPTSSLERARDIALDYGLHYVYVGNVPGHKGEHTYCPQCGQKVIERTGFFVQRVSINHGRCQFCQTPIPGVWEN
jgi:pyruvate formate lyase activating enzyme